MAEHDFPLAVCIETICFAAQPIQSMKAEILAANDPDAVQRASECIRRGEPIALPTETVYGLAADALNAVSGSKDFCYQGASLFRSAYCPFCGCKMDEGISSAGSGR